MIKPLWALNWTQFLGSLNDNIVKLLTIFFLIDTLGAEKSPLILSLAGIIYVVPFLLFSIPAGILADRVGKKDIILWIKIAEVLFALLGLASFYFGSQLGAFLTLFFFAVHSAVFAPSKYGIVPEIVEADAVIKANSVITSFTYLSMILGTFTASFLVQLTDGDYPLAALACLLVAIIGLFFARKIPKTQPVPVAEKVSSFKEMKLALKTASKTENLLLAIFGSSFFLFVGAFTQLNIIPYAQETLGLSQVGGGYLFLFTAIGIGIGAYLAGRVAKMPNELALSGVALLITFGGFFLLADTRIGTVGACALLLFLGISGGLYMVPLDSFIQTYSQENLRGKNVALTNFLSFLGVLIASSLLYLFDAIGATAQEGFGFVSFLTLIVAVLALIFTFRDLKQFIAIWIVSRAINFKGPFPKPRQITTQNCALVHLLAMGAFQSKKVWIEHAKPRGALASFLLHKFGYVSMEEFESYEDGILIVRPIGEEKTALDFQAPPFLSLLKAFLTGKKITITLKRKS